MMRSVDFCVPYIGDFSVISRAANALRERVTVDYSDRSSESERLWMLRDGSPEISGRAPRRR